MGYIARVVTNGTDDVPSDSNDVPGDDTPTPTPDSENEGGGSGQN